MRYARNIILLDALSDLAGGLQASAPRGAGRFALRTRPACVEAGISGGNGAGAQARVPDIPACLAFQADAILVTGAVPGGIRFRVSEPPASNSTA